jgi:succinyl-CoA:acetate CoA-transferase
MYMDRLRHKPLLGRVVSPEEAAALIKDNMTVGMSGFTRAGDAKAVPLAVARRAREQAIHISLMTGASLGHGIDGALAEAGVTVRRLPFQSDAYLRERINSGKVMFIDQHLSETVEMLRANELGRIDVAIVEAVAITEDGGIVPSSSVGNSASFAIKADKVILELNLSQSPEWEGLHDIYIPTRRPYREPIPILRPADRAGMPYIPIDPAKIAAIVITDEMDTPASINAPDADTQEIANHLVAFFDGEVRRGRLGPRLMPLQAGIGTIANAVLHGLVGSSYRGLTMYTEVAQDSAFELVDAGQMDFISCSSVTLSAGMQRRVFSGIGQYRERLLLRPQEISNHPEVIRRLGVIAINTALEADIYGNVNSTHTNGSNMMNGIGGSEDFARNGHLAIFVSKSLTKGASISKIVPMVTHVDHTEHDVDILVTEQGLADLRGLAPRERAPLIIEHCAHPLYRDLLRDYYREACRRGGHTPHLLEEAFRWHLRQMQTGTMQPEAAAAQGSTREEGAAPTA